MTVSFKTEGSVRRITATYRLDVRVLKAETTSVSSTSTLGTARDSARSLKQISSALGGLEKNSQPQLRN